MISFRIRIKRLYHERNRNRQTKTTCAHLEKLVLGHVDGKGVNGKLFLSKCRKIQYIKEMKHCKYTIKVENAQKP